MAEPQDATVRNVTSQLPIQKETSATTPDRDRAVRREKWFWIAVAFLTGAFAGNRGVVVPILIGIVFVFGICLTTLIIARGDRGAMRVASYFVALIVAYPLSVGPVGWLGMRFFPDHLTDVFVTLYLPLFQLRQSGFDQCAGVFEWYLRLWHLL